MIFMSYQATISRCSYQTSFRLNGEYAFVSDLGDCRTLDEHKGLVEDYEWFAETLGVDVSSQLSALEEQIDELEAIDDARADAMMDDYRESAFEARDTDSELRDLFDTLRRE